MNIAIITDVFPPKCGGSGWSSFYLAKGLQERGHKVQVILPKESPKPAVSEREYEGLTVTEYGYSAAKIPFVRNYTRNEHFYPRFAEFLADFFKKHQIDVAHGQHYLSIPATVQAAQVTTIGSVATVRDYWPVCYWTTQLSGEKICPGCSQLNRLKCLYNNQGALGIAVAPVSLYMAANLRLKQRWLAAADKTLAVSNYVAAKLKPFVAAERLAVVPNFIDTEKVAQIVAQNPANLPSEPFLLYVGKFEENKGVRALLETLRKVRPAIPTLAVGDGSLKTELEQAAHDGLNLQILGWRSNEEVMQLMNRATVLLYPSLWPEPLTRVLLEACGAQACIVALNTGGTSDIIRHGENGLLANSADEMAVMLQDILRPEQAATRQLLRDNALATAQGKFSREIVLDQVEQIYSEVKQSKTILR